MKDGLYDFKFKALGHTRGGTLDVRDNLADGADPIHRIRGQLARTGTNILASFDVTWRSTADGRDPGYSIKMTGTGSHTDFSVIGLAPLGLIVELEAQWKASPD